MRKTSSTSRLALASLLTALATFAAPSFAQSDGYMLAFPDMPAGIACSNFTLRIEYRGNPNFYKEFQDKNGNVVRVISAGSNIDYRATNVESGAKLDIGGTGGMSKTIPKPDGSYTGELNGHSFMILFPTDVPSGPSSTLHQGKVVYSVSSTGIFTIKSTTGNKTDLCKELS